MSTASESSVPKLRFDVFDSIYQQLYTTLAIELMLEPMLALQIMALWIWMEKSGFIDTVEKIHGLPLDLISGLADEAVLCINFFRKAVFPMPSELSNSIPLLHFLMIKELPLMFHPGNRASAVDGMKKVYEDICLKDLGTVCNEAIRIHETVKQKLADQEMAQITRSFSANFSLDDTTVGGNLSSSSSGLSGSGRIGFGLGSSSLLQPGSSSAVPGTFNVGLSKSRNSGPGHLSTPHNAAHFRPDPIKMLLPGSPVSPHGYVGMGRSTSSNRGLGDSSLSNRLIDARIQVPARPKPDVGVIGQPRLARSNSSHHEPTNRMTRGLNLSSHGHLILSPEMRVGPSTLITHVYQQHFPIPDTFVPAEQRTLFVTFSKGYRVHEGELRNYITACFGNCIESLYMQETPGDEQPLFARIVFYSPETIDSILDGNERFKFSVNGKHVWVRKYIPKNQRTNPNF